MFYRGITMQRAVERDAHNHSNYAMCAVNPSCISRTFTDAALREVVDDIANRTRCLLEIVTFNVEVRVYLFVRIDGMLTSAQGQQYVCAGELIALETMTNVLNYLKMEKIDIQKVCLLCAYGDRVLTSRTAHREVHCRPSQGDACRDHRLVLQEGAGEAAGGGLHQA